MEFTWNRPHARAGADNSYRIPVGVFFGEPTVDVTYAAMWAALLIFLASIISVEAPLSAAIIEITAGVLAKNLLGLHPAP